MDNTIWEILQERRKTVLCGGGDGKADKQHKAGKRTARERLEKILDPRSFVEIDAFVQWRGSDAASAPGEGVVAGYGTIEGNPVYIYAQDYTVLSGSVGMMHAKKICKVMELAMRNGHPIIALKDSAGARVEEGVDALQAYGMIFKRVADCSGVVPQVTAILGPCIGGASFVPAMADYVFSVRGISQAFSTSPQVLEACTGDAGNDDGGDAEKRGLVHFECDSEEACFDQIRALLSYLPSNNIEDAPLADAVDAIERAAEALNAGVAALGMRQVITAVLDEGSFLETQARFATNMITGFARLGGQAVGIVANAGDLDIDASTKAARFIRSCDCFNVPVISFVDVAGFVVDAGEEKSGLIRHGAKLVFAYAEATVPLITVLCGKAYGTAYVVMGSKAIGGDLVLAWADAQVSVLAPDAAVAVLWKNRLNDAVNPMDQRAELIETYAKEAASPFVAAEAGYVDDVIAPSETRVRLYAALDMLSGKRDSRPAKKHDNMPL